MLSLHDTNPLLTRRELLRIGSLALGGLSLPSLFAARAGASTSASPVTGKSVIFLFQQGGPSQFELFAHKPELQKLHGQPIPDSFLKNKRFAFMDTFTKEKPKLLGTKRRFGQHGQSGAWISDLLPNLGACVDDLVFLPAVVTKSSSHTPACFQMNTGFTQNGYPSFGSWLSYGLGSANQQLPTFVVLPDPRGLPNGGSNNWGEGFLPAEHQGARES